MNAIVFDYDANAQSKVNRTLLVVYCTGAGVLLVLALEAGFVFRPARERKPAALSFPLSLISLWLVCLAVRLIRKTFHDLQEAGLLNMRTNQQLALTKECVDPVCCVQ